MRYPAPRNKANLGKWFQHMVDAACSHYTAGGRAYIFPVPTPMKIIGHGIAVPLRKSTTDYLGFLPQGKILDGPGEINVPVGIAFDAKSTDTEVWRPPGFADRSTTHQVEILDLVHRLGHIAGFLLGFYPRTWTAPRTLWIPWPAARELVTGYWPIDKCLALAGAKDVPFIGYPDFLPVVTA